MDETRSRIARDAAEAALVRIATSYGGIPDFVLLGGLIPDLLCAGSEYDHAGTTDIDVQVNLEIAKRATNGQRLEAALFDAGFEPDPHRAWRWVSDQYGQKMVVKFELLADQENQPEGVQILFNGCTSLGAANLRGTRFALIDAETREVFTELDGVRQSAHIRVSGLAGFLLSKVSAARSRRLPKDWYDIAFVLIHNDLGGPRSAAEAVLSRFGADLGEVRTSVMDLAENFADTEAQGPNAYSNQMILDHSGLDAVTMRADAAVAVGEFVEILENG